jgi:hypothetical protein
LLNKPHHVTQSHSGRNQSAETSELYRHLSENGAFRRKAERFRGDYEWVEQDFGLGLLSLELRVGFFKLSPKDFSGPSEQDEPTTIRDEILSIMQATPPIPVNAPNALPKVTGVNPTVLSAVLSIFQEQPQGKGLTGKEIVVALRKKGIEIADATLRRHCLPKLKELYRIENTPSRGGYHLPLT